MHMYTVKRRNVLKKTTRTLVECTLARQSCFHLRDYKLKSNISITKTSPIAEVTYFLQGSTVSIKM
jgi:hypothetical protein